MKYLAAYALAELSGSVPTKKDVEAVLKSAGVAIDADRLESLFKELNGRKVADVAEEGKKKLVGSAAVTSGPAASSGASNAPVAAAAAAKEEEKEEEEDGMFDLFG